MDSLPERIEAAEGPKWRKAMMKAICSAAAETSLFKGSSRTYGLRAIRRFEEINKCAFDPFNDYHCHIIHGTGVHEKIHYPINRPTRQGATQ